LTVSLLRQRVDAILLDIEGTTTPISFVYEVLFPFARRHLREHLSARWTEEATREAVRGLRAEWSGDVERGENPPPWEQDATTEPSSVATYVEWLMDRDRKSQGLKLLQGHIWERGYESGAIESEVFPDVAPAAREWRKAGVEVAIYSSGSVLAQRLLFAHTAEGDLTPLVTAFFDTSVGPKTSPDSYTRIAAKLGHPPDRLVFLSDTVRELEAASQAGYMVLLCVRPGNSPQPSNRPYEVVHGLNDLVLIARS